jgi:hypothetical protein
LPDGSTGWKTVTYVVDDLMLDGRAFVVALLWDM